MILAVLVVTMVIAGIASLHNTLKALDALPIPRPVNDGLSKAAAAMAKALETCMPEECYGGVAEHVEDCAECETQDICERYEALRALAMYYGEEENA